MMEYQNTIIHTPIYDIFDPILDGTIKTSLQTFNTQYQLYLNCNCLRGNALGKGCKKGNPVNGCGADNSWANLVGPSYDTLLRTIDNALATIQPASLPNYDASMNNIKSNYADLLEFRNSLDAKVKSLNQSYTGRGETINATQRKMDTTIYTGVLWTILATTLVYYIITKK